MSNEIPDFYKAMQDKFEEKAKEEGRSFEPWKVNHDGFLIMRLDQEYKEFQESKKGTHYGNPVEYDELELVDIANFCRFLWIKKKLKQERTK